MATEPLIEDLIGELSDEGKRSFCNKLCHYCKKSWIIIQFCKAFGLFIYKHFHIIIGCTGSLVSIIAILWMFTRYWASLTVGQVYVEGYTSCVDNDGNDSLCPAHLLRHEVFYNYYGAYVC